MANKITKARMFAMIAEKVADNAEMVAFCQHEIELLEKKNGAKKPTARQKENEELMTTLVELVAVTPGTASEIIASNAELAGMTTQRISPMLNKLAEEGKIEKVVEKRKAIFRAI
jgi:hypothetical protein